MDRQISEILATLEHLTTAKSVGDENPTKALTVAGPSTTMTSSNHGVVIRDSDMPMDKQKGTEHKAVVVSSTTIQSHIAHDLGAPTIKLFENPDDLMQEVHKVAAENGYGVRRANRVTSKTGALRSFYIRCAHSDEYAATHAGVVIHRQRERCSRKQGCPFKLYAHRYQFPRDHRWELEIRESRHNHASDSASVYPVHRRLDLVTWEKIRSLDRLGLKNSEITEAIRKESPHTIPKQVENARAVLRAGDRKGPIPQLPS